MNEIINLFGKEFIVYRENGQAVRYDRKDHITSDSVSSILLTMDTILIADYKILKTPDIFAVDVLISREGVYPYPERNQDEAKLGPDLKLAAKYVQSIPSFDRHPMHGERGIDILLGTVQNITFDKNINGIRGKNVLWRDRVESYELLHDAIQTKKPFPVSIGQYNTLGKGGNLAGVPFQARQDNILLDHMDNIVDGSEPRCALGSCGINVDTLSNSSVNLLEKIVITDVQQQCPLKNIDTESLFTNLLKNLEV